MGDSTATPLVEGAGARAVARGGVMSTVVKDVTYAAVRVLPTRSRTSAMRTVKRVSSFSSASGVKVTVVSPLPVRSVPSIVRVPSLSVTFACVALPGSIGSENVICTLAARGTPVAEGAGDTLTTEGAAVSSTTSARTVAPLMVPVRDTIPSPIGSCSVSA